MMDILYEIFPTFSGPQYQAVAVWKGGDSLTVGTRQLDSWSKQLTADWRGRLASLARIVKLFYNREPIYNSIVIFKAD